MSQFFASGDQSIGASASASVLPMNLRYLRYLFQGAQLFSGESHLPYQWAPMKRLTNICCKFFSHFLLPPLNSNSMERAYIYILNDIQTATWRNFDYVCVHVQWLSCVQLCDPMDCSPPDSSVHEKFPSKNTGVDCHFLLQGIFLTQGLKPCLLHWQADS